MKHIHTIPVPTSMTPEQAWTEICVMGHLVELVGLDYRWANIECDGEECLGVEWSGAGGGG